MRYILLFFLVFSTIGDGLKKASRINAGVQRATQLYSQERYQQAADQYRYLINTLRVKDDELLLNLAHATYQAGEKNQAQKFYQRLRDNANPGIQAAALNQLGIISFNQANPEKALYFFKKAIVQDPQNDIARYNYELVQKYRVQNPARIGKNSGQQKNQAGPKPESKPQSRQKAGETGHPENQDDFDNSGTAPPRDEPQEKLNQVTDNAKTAPKATTSGQNQVAQGPAGGASKGMAEGNNAPNPGSPGKGGDEAILEKERQMQTLRQRLSKTDLTAEKAAMLLEAMRQAELQYLQQLPRRPARPPDKGQPDW